jgi:hypothetical protein
MGFISTNVTNNKEEIKESDSIMTTNDNLKMGVEPTPEKSCIPNIPQTVDNVQHSTPIINQRLS